jgi:hypothetical protein
MGMQIGRIIDGVVLALAMAAPMAHAQAVRSADSSRLVMISSPGPSSPYPALSGAIVREDIVREIDDPGNGDRWLLMRNGSHPAGPGLLKLVSAVGAGRTDPSRARQTTPAADTPPPVIRAGDRVVVEENTAVVEAHLEAVAMSPAWAGSAFDVRLSIGGRMVRAVAQGPGRAVLQEETRP